MSPEARLSRLAALQEGNVTTRQCLEAGLSERQIEGRRANGVLIARHRGVWAWGHRPESWFSAAFAAWLAYGRTSALSHVTCAAVLQALPEPYDVPLHLTRPTRGREHGGTRLHSADLAGDVWHRRGLVLTSPARLMLDLAATEPAGVVERAYNQAQVLRLLTPAHLKDRLDGWRGRRGVTLLRSFVDDQGATRSVLEDLFRRLVEAAGVARPRFNAWVEGILVDAVWFEERVIVELDSRAFHGHDQAFEGDRAKGNRLTVKGWTVLRFTYRQLTKEPMAVVATLATALHPRR